MKETPFNITTIECDLCGSNSNVAPSNCVSTVYTTYICEDCYKNLKDNDYYVELKED